MYNVRRKGGGAGGEEEEEEEAAAVAAAYLITEIAPVIMHFRIRSREDLRA